MSPELLDPEMFGLEESHPTKESDCYALGMVIYEVLSGQIPFASSGAPVVIRKVLSGERPERPQGSDGELFTDGIWTMVQLCWKPQPHDRIGAEAVLLGLEGNPIPSRLSSNVEGGAETDSDDQSDTIASDSGMFYPLCPGLVLDYPRAMIEPPILQVPDGLQALRSRPPYRPSPTVMVQPPVSPQMDGSTRVSKLVPRSPESPVDVGKLSALCRCGLGRSGGKYGV
jgi:hypothetical protein